MNGIMHPNRVGLRSTLLVTASLAGILVGALAGYGCSSGASQRSEPLPIATAHRTPRLAPMVEPPVVVQAADVPPPVDPYEPRPAVPSAEPDLRVRIAALRAATASARVSHPAGGLVMSSADGSTRTLRSPVDVRCNQNAVTVTEGAGTKASRAHTIAGRQPVDFKPPVGARTVVTYDGIDWPGALRVVPTNDGPGAMDLVVSVPMEQYLPGVLARELYKSWNPETFRAQAIAARSYAVCERAHWETCRHYDLIAGEASQAWIGEVKDVRARQAVADTRGMVLVFEDKIVPAYYSSTCGGVPANAVDSLTRNPNHGIAPLEAGADAANSHRDCCKSAPRFRWEQTLPVTRVVTQLRRWAGDQLAVERASLARIGANAPRRGERVAVAHRSAGGGIEPGRAHAGHHRAGWRGARAGLAGRTRNRATCARFIEQRGRVPRWNGDRHGRAARRARADCRLEVH
jgi:hypothetical protein